MANNTDLHKANTAKKDEFYTALDVVSAEMRYHRKFFKDKVVLCNCDDPFESNFFKYFALNFNRLKLKKLIATCYKGSPVVATQLSWIPGKEASKELNTSAKKKAYKIVITEVPDVNGDGAIDITDVEWLIKHGDNVLTELKGDGDFRSDECIELLKSCDVVCTNPPFSLFREYMKQLIKYDKKFLIIGNVNAITYKEIFPLIKDNKLWMGASIHSGDREFRVPDDYPLKAAGCRVDEDGNKYIRVKGVRWWTNIDYPSRHEELDLYKKYNPDTVYISYGAELSSSLLKDDDPAFVDWLNKWGLAPKEYFLVVGRLVPENNYAIMIREYLNSGINNKKLVFITNNDWRALDKMKEEMGFKGDDRIVFTGSVYNEELLKKIRENAFAYLHGHEVGGTNPSLLEALSSTDLNLLLKVPFNEEVGKDAALYWTKDVGSLKALLKDSLSLTNWEISEYRLKARKRILDSFNWDDVASKYADLFL